MWCWGQCMSFSVHVFTNQGVKVAWVKFTIIIFLFKNLLQNWGSPCFRQHWQYLTLMQTLLLERVPVLSQVTEVYAGFLMMMRWVSEWVTKCVFIWLTRKVGTMFFSVCVHFGGVYEDLYIVCTRMAQHEHLQTLLIVVCTRLSCEWIMNFTDLLIELQCRTLCQKN